MQRVSANYDNVYLLLVYYDGDQNILKFNSSYRIYYICEKCGACISFRADRN